MCIVVIFEKGHDRNFGDRWYFVIINVLQKLFIIK